MPTYDVAHIRERGIDLIIVRLESSFGRLPLTDQQEEIRVLQQCASSAGLAGTVVPVWDAGSGQMGFIAPPNWHRFFGSINLGIVARNINRRLACQ